MHEIFTRVIHLYALNTIYVHICVKEYLFFTIFGEFVGQKLLNSQLLHFFFFLNFQHLL